MHAHTHYAQICASVHLGQRLIGAEAETKVTRTCSRPVARALPALEPEHYSSGDDDHGHLPALTLGRRRPS